MLQATWPRRRTVTSLMLLTFLITSGLTPASAAAPSAPLDSYVGLGESGAAGPLIPNQNLQQPGCLRSDHNYPSMIAETLQVHFVRDVSCSGARIRHVFEPQDTPLGAPLSAVPPQLDAVDGDTTLVTVDFGSNDINAAELFTNCVRLPPPVTSPCAEEFTADGHDVFAERIAATAPDVGAMLAAIRKRAPRAKIFVIGKNARLPVNGCYPTIPILPSDANYIRSTFLSLNRMLAEQARRHGATFVDTYSPSVGHDACQLPGIRWMEPYLPAAPAAPWHSNAVGHKNIADIAVDSIRASHSRRR